MYLPPLPFHAALAIAHRSSATSDFVLRETGQTVGNKENGVTELWQGILGCDCKGMVMTNGESDRFWCDWEERLFNDD